MAKLFVSFLGTSPYVPCSYGVDMRRHGPVQFVQTATLHLKCADWGTDDRVVIGCTKLAREKNFDALKTELKSSGWSVEPEVVDLPDGTSEEELWTIFERLLDRIGEGDELVFDITHSFRSLPMLFTVLIQYLRVARSVRLRGVYYGAFEKLGRPGEVEQMPIDERNAPIIDLTGFLTLYDWSAAIDHFLRFGSPTDLEQLVGEHLGPILKVTAGAQQDAKATRRVVEYLGRFARCAQYVRGRELAQFPFQLEIVGPLQHIGGEFVPPLKPVLRRLGDTFVEFRDGDPDNALRSVAWCIDHDLIQQGITLLQEAIIDHWVRRCADLLDSPTTKMSKVGRERWRRAFVSDLLGVLGQGIPATEWKKSLADFPAVAQACAERLTPRLVAEYDKLTKLRNDINHGGYIEPRKWHRLREGLRDGYKALQALWGEDLATFAAESAREIYLLNTPILTAYGDFAFSGPIDLGEARRRIAGGFASAIGHQASADFLSALLGIDVPANRVAVTMQPGDAALVLRLTERLPEGRVLNAEEMAAVPYELGWLERTA